MQSKAMIPDLFAQPAVEKFFQHLTLNAPSATLVGGAIRDSYLSPGDPPNDLDLVVANSEFDKAVNGLLSASYELGENRHGNPRFWINAWDDEMHVDLWSPARFYIGYASIEEMLTNFDLSVNAVGIELLSGTPYDPVGGFSDLADNVTRLLVKQWTDLDVDYIYHLVNRLNKLLETYPTLKILNPELALAQIEKLEKLEAETEEQNKKAWELAFPDLMPVKTPPPKLVGGYPVKPLTLQTLPVSWKEVKLKGVEEPVKLIWQDEEPAVEEEVCAMWAAGDRCPGCMGCPFPEDD